MSTQRGTDRSSDEGRVDLGEAIRYIWTRRFPIFLIATSLTLAGLGITAYQRFTRNPSVAGTINFSFRGIEQHQYPNGRHFGNSVAGVTDVNGDGRGDIVIGAAREDAGGLSNSGRVHVYSGASGARLRTIVSPGNEMLGEFGHVECLH